MSIADKLGRLSDARDDIITALAGKGVTATGHGFEDFPDDIDSIQQGGGGNYQTKSVTPTESAQTVTADNGYDALAQVNVGAISSSYVGSNVPRRDSDDLSASGGTVSVPAGYYASAASKSVASGTAGTPTATKGTVSNHSVTVTPKVVNTEGFISGGTKTGTGVSVTAAELVSDRLPINSNGSFDVTNYEEVLVSVQGGSGIGTLLKTYSMGTISTTSTQAADTGKTITGVDISDGYDLLIVETSVNSVTNNRHTATVGMILLTASSTVGTKNGATVCSNKWNSKISSSGVTTTRQNTTAYGIYPYSCTFNNESLSISMYQRYNSTQTGTINNTYTARVYGVKLFDMIGG